MTIDAVGWIASMSKLVTSVGAMQLVEKGLIKLDDDVGKFVPQLSNMDIVTGAEDGQLKMRKQSKPITLRSIESSPYPFPC
jgi:methyl acetate hydrolase